MVRNFGLINRFEKEIQFSLKRVWGQDNNQRGI